MITKIGEQQPVKAFWVDDQPDTLKDLVTRLKKHNINVDLFPPLEPPEIFATLGTTNNPGYQVGFFDLLLDHKQGLKVGTGLNYAQELRGFVNGKYSISLPFVSISGHQDIFSDQLTDNSLFVDNFKKTDLDESKIIDFVEIVRKHAFSLYKYIANDPPSIDTSIYKRINACIGYVDSCIDDLLYVKVIDPETRNDIETRIFKKEFLASRNINHIGQTLRILSYENRENQHVLFVLEPVTTGEKPKWRKLRQLSNYNEFIPEF